MLELSNFSTLLLFCISGWFVFRANKKAQLTQRETRNSGACLKAHCEQNLSSLIPKGVTGLVQRTAVKWLLFRWVTIFDALVHRPLWTYGPFKFMFNVENFIRRWYWSVCSDFGTIRSWIMCCSPKLSKSQ